MSDIRLELNQELEHLDENDPITDLIINDDKLFLDIEYTYAAPDTGGDSSLPNGILCFEEEWDIDGVLLNGIDITDKINHEDLIERIREA